MTKICSRCKAEKEITEFFRQPRNKDGLFSICKECTYLRTKPYLKKWYQKNKIKQLQVGKKYYKKNNEKRKKYQQNYNLKPEKRYKKYIEGAKIRNITFDLTFNQFMTFWEKPCSYCGNKIKTIELDRMENNQGYTINNIISCCLICNKMKRILSKNDFVNQCKKISDYSF